MDMETLMARELLTVYLAAIDCPKAVVWHIVTELWEEKAAMELLEFCDNNRDATQAELLEMSSKISLKYRTEPIEE